jgi:hypothetical protein
MGIGGRLEGYWSAHDPSIEEIAEIGGRYIDRWEKRGGIWRIARRIGVHDWERWGPANLPGARTEAVASPSRSKADPVYRRD